MYSKYFSLGVRRLARTQCCSDISRDHSDRGLLEGLRDGARPRPRVRVRPHGGQELLPKEPRDQSAFSTLRLICTICLAEAEGDRIYIYIYFFHVLYVQRPPCARAQIPSDQYSADPSRAEQQIITHMLFSPSEETIALITDRSQIYSLALSTADLAKVPSACCASGSCSSGRTRVLLQVKSTLL